MSRKEDKRSKARKNEERWKELLQSSSSGNTSDYDILLHELYEYLRVFCSRYIYSSVDAEDCVQNCITAIHNSKHTYSFDKPFGPWFFTIVKRKIFDHYRSSKRYTERVLLDADYDLVQGAVGGELDLEGEVGKLLENLNPKNREIIELTKLKGLSVSQVSKKLEIGESAVKVRTFRATKALKDLIEKEFDKRI